MFRIATWNVNSIRARMQLVTNWLERMKPDVLLLQEIKGEAESFPRLEFTARGYHALVVGQKSYNGVAMLSREPPTDVLNHLPGDPADTQARYLEATFGDVRVASLYLPNGNPVGTEKYTYKRAWMERFKIHAKKLLEGERPVVLGGDYNVIPTPKDVYDPKAWEQDALYRPEIRATFREIETLGYTDAFRALHPDQNNAYSFWDYQAGAWQQDQGLRIDHFLLSPEAVDKLSGGFIDRTPRGEDKASDHTPVVVDLA